MSSFFEKYNDYKLWWLTYQCGGLYGAEVLFEDHVNSMGLCGFLETLDNWDINDD